MEGVINGYMVRWEDGQTCMILVTRCGPVPDAFNELSEASI